MPAEMTAEERLELIKEVYHKCYGATESFETVGAGLAYLLAGIATDDGYTMFQNFCEAEQEFHDLITANFPADHRVWKFIELVPEESDGSGFDEDIAKYGEN